MPSPADALSLLLAVEFVAMATFVAVVAPPLLPLLFVCLVAIHLSRS